MEFDTWDAEGGRIAPAKTVSIFDIPGKRYNVTKGVYPKRDKLITIDGPTLTKSQINSQLKKHNVSVKKRMYHNLTRTIVYGGHNTT